MVEAAVLCIDHDNGFDLAECVLCLHRMQDCGTACTHEHDQFGRVAANRFEVHKLPSCLSSAAYCQVCSSVLGVLDGSNRAERRRKSQSCFSRLVSNSP